MIKIAAIKCNISKCVGLLKFFFPNSFAHDVQCYCTNQMFLTGMLIPSGTCTDGEFIQLRTQGATRPIHVWQLIHNAKKKVGKVKKKDLLDRLIPVGGIHMIVFNLSLSTS